MANFYKALLFDLSKENVEANKNNYPNLLSGNNILNDILKFENDCFVNNPFVQLIDIEGDPEIPDLIVEKKFCEVLGIEEKDFLLYSFYSRKNRNEYLFITQTRGIQRINIIASKKMLHEGNIPIFEISYYDYFPTWQAISGKFIIIGESFIEKGVKDVYSSIREYPIENFKNNNQLRYSGVLKRDINEISVPEIAEDPINPHIRKIVIPNTLEILFDSSIIHELSKEASLEAWQKFESRYKLSNTKE